MKKIQVNIIKANNQIFVTTVCEQTRLNTFDCETQSEANNLKRALESTIYDIEFLHLNSEKF